MIASHDKTLVVEGNLVFGHSLMDRFRLDQFEGDVWFLVCSISLHPAPSELIPLSISRYLAIIISRIFI